MVNDNYCCADKGKKCCHTCTFYHYVNEINNVTVLTCLGDPPAPKLNSALLIGNIAQSRLYIKLVINTVLYYCLQ